MARALRVQYAGAIYHIVNLGHRQLREETTMRLKWIAERLNMGTWEYLRRMLYEARNERSS